MLRNTIKGRDILIAAKSDQDHSGLGQMDLKGPWLEVRVKVPTVAQEAFSAFLFDLGCLGTSQLEGDDLLVAYFPHKTKEPLLSSIKGVLRGLTKHFPEIRPSRLQIREVPGEDWAIKWRQHFKAQKITDSLMVIPPWEPRPCSWRGEVIIIEPGPAFGTGQHPTTRLSLVCMEDSKEQTRGKVLDVGTGSGILAIWAARLGAQRVVGIDIDVEAVKWARKNLELNGLTNQVLLLASDIGAVKEGFHLVLANLTHEEILKIKSDLIRVLRPGGRLILSGFLISQAESVMKAFNKEGLILVKEISEKEWGALVLDVAER